MALFDDPVVAGTCGFGGGGAEGVVVGAEVGGPGVVQCAGEEGGEQVGVLAGAGTDLRVDHPLGLQWWEHGGVVFGIRPSGGGVISGSSLVVGRSGSMWPSVLIWWCSQHRRWRLSSVVGPPSAG